MIESPAHTPWQDWLPYYVAGTLAADEAAAVEQHLATCAFCRAAVDEWRAIAGAVYDDVAGRRAELPPLRLPLAPPFYIQSSGNGRADPVYPTEENEMTTVALPLPRRRVPMTLVAAVLMAVLFAGVMLVFPFSPGGDHNGAPAVIQSDLTASATPFPTTEPPQAGTGVDQVVTATPLPVMPPTVVPPAVVTATPLPDLDSVYTGAVGEVIPAYSDEFALQLCQALAAYTEEFALQLCQASAYPGQSIPLEDCMNLLEAWEPEMLIVPGSVLLVGVPYEAQEWNNQGPASLAMALGYWGWDGSQETAREWLKPHREDPSVMPWQMVAFTNLQTGYRALYRGGGTLSLLKRLLAAGFPVIVQVSYEPDGDWVGHTLVLVGYDDAAGRVLTYDPYLGNADGAGRPVPYGEFDEAWRHFNRTFVVVYDPERESELAAALGSYADPVYAAQAALGAANRDLIADEDDLWGLLNRGESYLTLGEVDRAVEDFDRALAQYPDGPFKLLLYRTAAFAAYFAAGRYDDVLHWTELGINTSRYVEDLFYWQALARAMTGDRGQAADDLVQVLALNPNFFAGQVVQFGLEPAGPDLLRFGSGTGTAGTGEVQAPEPVPDLPSVPVIVQTVTPTALPPLNSDATLEDCVLVTVDAEVLARARPGVESQIVVTLGPDHKLVLTGAEVGTDGATWYQVGDYQGDLALTLVWVDADQVAPAGGTPCRLVIP